MGRSHFLSPVALSPPLMPTHLLSNGHLRCGVHPGHISQMSWPGELRVTANPEATDCPGCRSRAGLPPIEVSNDLAQVVEIRCRAARQPTV